MKQPLLRITAYYVGGILVADWIRLPPTVLLGVTWGLSMLALAWVRGRDWLLYPLIIVAGWTNATLHTAVISPCDLRVVLGEQPALATVRGRLLETPSLRMFELGQKESWRTLARLEITALRPNQGNWQPATGRLAATTPGTLTNLFGGQIVEVTGVIARPCLAVAEGTFDYRHFLEQQGIYYQLKAEGDKDWEIRHSPQRRPLADRFRDWARPALARGLPDEDESLRLEWALTLGWKPALTEEVSDPFVRAATYHIFAVDGLRMAIVFGIFFGLFRALRINRAIAGLLLLPVIWFYVALTGWPASAIRATVMLSVIVVGWVLQRPSDILNSLFAAALIILVGEPRQLYQAGFQLSFCVVLCLLLMMPPLVAWVHGMLSPDPLLPAKLHRQWPLALAAAARYVLDVFLTSFAAWIGSVPLAAYYFHVFTPVSTPANLLAVPLCALVLVCNLTSLLVVTWLPTGAECFNHAGWFLMEIIRITSRWFADRPGACLNVPAPSLWTTLLYYGLLLAILTGWLFKPARLRLKLASLALALAMWLIQAWPEFASTRLTCLPTGGGCAVYFDAPGRKHDWLLDPGATNSVRMLTKPFLQAQGVNRLSKLILTHGDLRHIGGAGWTAELFPAKEVWISPVRFRSPVYRKLVAHFAETPGLVHTGSQGDQWESWNILHPRPQDRFPKADDNALVLSGAICGTRVLLLSDLGRLGQNALLDCQLDLKADIVVAGLPGGGEALSDALLDQVQPRLILVVDSEFPAWERASAALQSRLARRQVPVVYTRLTGAATIEFRPGTWRLRTMNGLNLRSHLGSVLSIDHFY